jgi:septal ring factor EnvC (AmiA/AmiB activator)
MSTVTEARLALQRAEEAQAAKQRAAQIEELASIRAELAEKRGEFAALEKRVKDAQATLDNIERERNVYADALGQLESLKPPIFDVLPADPESVAWARKRDTLQARIDELRTLRAALGSVDGLRFTAVQLRERIAALEFGESNLLRVLNGEVGRGRVGGVLAPS